MKDAYLERLANEQARRDRKREAGVCIKCPRPAVEGRRRCEACAEKHRQETREAKAARMVRQTDERRAIAARAQASRMAVVREARAVLRCT